MFAVDLPEKLLRSLRRFDRRNLANKLVGVSLCPEYQANHPRILTLLEAAMGHARGCKKASQSDLANLLNGLSEHIAYQSEDPPEDVFVSAVSTPDGQFRIFNSLYSETDFYLQRMLDAVLSREFEGREDLWAQTHALLSISEAVAARIGLNINTFEQSTQWRTNWMLLLPPLRDRGDATHFSWAELNCDRASLAPFFLNASPGDDVCSRFSFAALSHRPLVLETDGVWLPVPSLVSSALRLHLAKVAMESGIGQDARASFHSVQLARWLACDLALRKTTPLTAALPLPEPEIDVPGFTQALVRFDEDKLAHLIILESSWSQRPDGVVLKRQPMPAPAQQALVKFIAEAHRQFQAEYGADRGLTLVIYDSPGWDLDGPDLADISEHWFCIDLSSHNLSALFTDPRFSFLNLWKMWREKRAFEASGLILQIWPSALAYWSVWRAFGDTFWPERIDVRQFGSLMADTSKIAELLVPGRLMRGAHAAELPWGEWRRVERSVEEVSITEDLTKPIFLDPIALALGDLLGVSESERGAWWVTSARPFFDPEDKQYIYLLWQAALEWLRRIAATADGRLDRREVSLQIRLLPVPATILDAPSEIEFAVAEDLAIVTLILPPTFIDTLATPDNSGESVLVGNLIDCILLAYGATLSATDRRVWLDELMRDPDMKMIHVNQSADAGFAADLDPCKTALRLLQLSDAAAAARHMRDELAEIALLSLDVTTEHVEGAQAVNDALKAATEIHWMRCRDLLKELDRTQTLVLISRLIEATHRSRVQEERAARARPRFYADSPDYDPHATIGTRDTAFRAYRIAAEMALCEAPMTGGRPPGLSDIDTLAAEISEIIRTAHQSDAVHYGLIVPRIEFRADGAIEIDNASGDFSMPDYSIASIGETIAFDQDAYSRLFERRGTEEDGPEDDEEGFLSAFDAEFKISLPQAAAVIHALQAVAAARSAGVVSIRRSELAQEARAADGDVTPDVLDAFLRSFSLVTRQRWDTPPQDYMRDDIWPWLFERRLSLMMRPVQILTDDVDPPIMYGVRQIQMSFLYASILLEDGVWPKTKLRSDEARAYVDAEINRRGDRFEQEIQGTFTQAGWEAFRAEPMTRFGASRKYGDVDVLAISPDGATWIVVECKWFGAVRTPREVASWLQDFRGRDGDKLYRHLRRHAWIKAHVQEVAAALGVDPAPTSIIPKIVTTIPVPLAFVSNLPDGADVWTHRELRAYLGAQSRNL